MSMETVAAGAMEFQKTIFNGEAGVEVVQGQSNAYDDKKVEEAKLESRIFPELVLAEYGAQVELTGLEAINQKQAYVVQVQLPSGKTRIMYFDTTSGLKLKESQTVETPQGNFTQSVEYKEYQEVEGIMFPSKASINIGPQVLDAQISSIELNKGIPDETFNVE